jgi:hypothetical protein
LGRHCKHFRRENEIQDGGAPLEIAWEEQTAKERLLRPRMLLASAFAYDFAGLEEDSVEVGNECESSRAQPSFNLMLGG